MEKEKLVDLIRRKEKENKLLFMTCDGIAEADIDKFMEQPVEGILYDLNRSKVVCLTLINKEPQWVNNYATAIVIEKFNEKLKQAKKGNKMAVEKIAILLGEIKELKTHIELKIME